MLKTKEFSHSLVYKKIEDFCTSQGITQQQFKNFNSPPLVYGHLFVNNNNRELTHAFKISFFHSLQKKFEEHFSSQYSFESKLKAIVKEYESFFNVKKDVYHEKPSSCYMIQSAYIIDMNDDIQRILVFNFEELSTFKYCGLVFELKDSNILELEQQVFDYYKNMFPMTYIPEELNKPFGQMTDDEKRLLSMVLI